MHAMYEFGWTLKQWADMEYKERITVIAMIQIRQEEEKKQQDKAEREARSKSRRH